MKESLIPSKRMKRATNREIKQLLSDVLSVSYADGTELRNNILVVLFFCTYTTAADLSYYLGMPENAFKSLHSLLNKLEKAGLIKSVNIGVKDAFSRVFYYLTENGFMVASSLMQENYQFTYKKRGKTATTVHDYSVGINALHVLLYGIPFSWAKEVSYSSSHTGVKKVGSLCVDAVCDFKASGNRLYIEEDLGNESIGILLGKLEKYQYYQLLKHPDTDALVFSFRKAYITCDAPSYMAYSAKNVERVLEYMLSSQKGLNEAYKSLTEDDYLSDTDKHDLQLTMESLINILNGSFKDREITAETLKLYLKDLTELKLDARVQSMNEAQNEFTAGRYRAMAGLLVKKFNNRDSMYAPYLSSLLKGFPVYCLTTNLLMNYLPYIHYEQAGMQYSMAACLSSVFPGCSAAQYMPVMQEKLDKQDGERNALALRNAFVYQGGVVCVEYVSKDIGGLLRASLFAQKHCPNHKNVHLICLVDSVSDAFFVTGDAFIGCGFPGKDKWGIPWIAFLEISSLAKKPFFFTVDDKGTRIPL